VLKGVKRKLKGVRLLSVLFVLTVLLFTALNVPALISAVSENAPDSLAALRNCIDDGYQDDFSYKNDFINLNGLVARVEGKTLLNDRLRTKDGWLLALEGSRSEATANTEAQQLNAFAQTVTQTGADFAWIQIPYKFDGSATQYPMSNACNELSDSVRDSLTANGVNVLDLKQAMQDAGLDFYSGFFRTDHHWTTQRAKWAFETTMTYLHEQFGCAVDEQWMGDENWQEDFYPNQYMGSDGRRVGIYFAGVDDFTLIYASDDVSPDYTYLMPMRRMVKRGSFANALLSTRSLGKPNYFKHNNYGAYLYSDTGVACIQNPLAVNQTRVLLLKDSFSLPLAAYLSLEFSEVILLDLRYTEGITAADVLAAFDPELVLCTYNRNVIGSSTPLIYNLSKASSAQEGEPVVSANNVTATGNVYAKTLLWNNLPAGSFVLQLQGTEKEAETDPYFFCIELTDMDTGKEADRFVFLATGDEVQQWDVEVPAEGNYALQVIAQAERDSGEGTVRIASAALYARPAETE